MARGKVKKNEFIRKNRQTFILNDLEKDAFDKFCKKYNIKNKSKFIREVVITNILEQFDKDYPTLFDEFDRKHRPRQTVIVFDN